MAQMSGPLRTTTLRTADGIEVATSRVDDVIVTAAGKFVFSVDSGTREAQGIYAQASTRMAQAMGGSAS